MPPPEHDHHHPHAPQPRPAAATRPTMSVLAWPAWQRVLLVLPLLLLLWLAVAWANAGSEAAAW